MVGQLQTGLSLSIRWLPVLIDAAVSFLLSHSSGPSFLYFFSQLAKQQLLSVRLFSESGSAGIFS